MRVPLVCAALALASVFPATAAAQSQPVDDDAPPRDPPKPASPRARLGVDLAFARAGSSLEGLTTGSPSRLTVGADGSLRVATSTWLGVHAHAGLASRDDCMGNPHCLARAYGVGFHVEWRAGGSVAPWLRVGPGLEVVYQGGVAGFADGHVYRTAIDLLDVRVGADFRIGSPESRWRLGPFLGGVFGAQTGQSGVVRMSGWSNDLSAHSFTPHLWFVAGVRGTTDAGSATAP